jgi:hypothetical protein
MGNLPPYSDIKAAQSRRWSGLSERDHRAIKQAQSEGPPKQPERDDRELLEELVNTTREIASELASSRMAQSANDILQRIAAMPSSALLKPYRH